MKQNNRKLMTALLLVWLLGPVEPVFADGIADQFPDVVSRSQANGRTWAVETTPQPMRDSGPWTVEMWSRGRRRYKHFHGQNNSGYTNYPSYSSSSNYGNPSNYSNSGNSSSPYPYNPPASFAALNRSMVPNGSSYSDAGAAGQTQPFGRPYQGHIASAAAPGQFGGGNAQFGGGNAQFGGGSGQFGGGNGQYNGPVDMNGNRRPDKFADTPQVDSSGIRHFANGRHHDLTAVPMEQALADTAAADEQIKADRDMARARQRERMRRRRNNNF